jgi:hypothetical protein
MGIFRALGFTIFLISLALLLPTVFAELGKTIVIFLQSSQTAFTAAGILASYSAHLPHTSLPSPSTLLSQPAFIPPH